MKRLVLFLVLAIATFTVLAYPTSNSVKAECDCYQDCQYARDLIGCLQWCDEVCRD